MTGEGAMPLSPEERDGLRLAYVATREQLNEAEQANIAAGLLWLDRQKRPNVLSQEFLLGLHRRLFGEVWDWAGTFRRTGKNIGVDPPRIAAELRTLLDDARYWLDHATYPSSEIAIRFHHRLVSIHLFANGNGRHGRIATDALLEKAIGARPIDWRGGYDLHAMGPRRRQYIDALRAADGHDLAPLLAFIGPRDDLA